MPPDFLIAIVILDYERPSSYSRKGQPLIRIIFGA